MSSSSPQAEARGPGPRRSFLGALDERLGLSRLGYEVPAHANTLPYSLGGITAVTMLILVVSGIVLAQYYHPSLELANHSVRTLMESVGVARIARGVHAWAAQAAIVLVLLHLFRVFYSGSYRRPREVNWLIGVALLAVTVGLFFSGTVLKWDQEGFEALEHNVAIGEMLGRLGTWFAGQFTASVPLLLRLYIAHVSFLPMALVLLLIGHFWLVRYHGISGGEAAEHRTTFGRHLGHLAWYGLAVLGAVLVLAVAFPPGIGPAPVEGVEVTKPPWVFLPLFAVENWVGIEGLVWAAVAAFAGLVVIPVLDRSRTPSPRDRRVLLLAGAVLVLVLAGLAIYARLAPGAEHMGWLPRLPG